MQLKLRFSFCIATLIAFESAAQKSFIISRDTIQLVSLYYVGDVGINEAQVFSYIIHNRKLYNASRYLSFRNSGCIPTPLTYVDNKCTFKLLQKYERANVLAARSLKDNKLVGFKSVELDAIFISDTCSLLNKEQNPLEDLFDYERNRIAHILNIASKKVKIVPLPEVIADFLVIKHD